MDERSLWKDTTCGFMRLELAEAGADHLADVVIPAGLDEPLDEALPVRSQGDVHAEEDC
jgi:hypothetical protein